MSARLGTSYREITRKDGRKMIVKVVKRSNLCTELRRKDSKRIRVARKGQV